MAINFPASPSTDETHTENSITWVFNGTAWNALGEQITPSSIGLGNVDNTADAAKPVSTAQQTALNLKANLSIWAAARYRDNNHAIDSNLPMGTKFDNWSEDNQSWPDVINIALAGDSIFNNTTSSGITTQQAGTTYGLEAYHQSINVIQPTGRTSGKESFLHAVGGTDTAEFVTGQSWSGITVTQSAELIAQKANIDAVVIHLGPNDIKSATYDLTTSMARMHTSVIDPLVAEGMMVILQTVLPGDNFATDSGGVYSDDVEAWNELLITEFRDAPNVMLFDVRAFYAASADLGLITRAGGDGTHPSISAAIDNGKLIGDMLAFLLPTTAPTIWDGIDIINENPYLKSAGTYQLQRYNPSNGATGTIAYVNRTDGETDEREAEFTLDYSTQGLGSGNALVTYVSAGGNNILVDHFSASSTNNAAIDVQIADNGSWVYIRVDPVRTGTTITSTATEIASAVNTAASAYVTATAGGTGADVITSGRASTVEVRIPLGATDAIVPSNGDVIRAVFEVLPKTGESFLTMSSRIVLRSGAGSQVVTGGNQTWSGEEAMPSPSGESIIIKTPWHTVAAGQDSWAFRSYFSGHGTFKLRRAMIQRQQ